MMLVRSELHYNNCYYCCFSLCICIMKNTANSWGGLFMVVCWCMESGHSVMQYHMFSFRDWWPPDLYESETACNDCVIFFGRSVTITSMCMENSPALVSYAGMSGMHGEKVLLVCYFLFDSRLSLLLSCLFCQSTWRSDLWSRWAVSDDDSIVMPCCHVRSGIALTYWLLTTAAA